MSYEPAMNGNLIHKLERANAVLVEIAEYKGDNINVLRVLAQRYVRDNLATP